MTHSTVIYDVHVTSMAKNMPDRAIAALYRNVPDGINLAVDNAKLIRVDLKVRNNNM